MANFAQFELELINRKVETYWAEMIKCYIEEEELDLDEVREPDSGWVRDVLFEALFNDWVSSNYDFSEHYADEIQLDADITLQMVRTISAYYMREFGNNLLDIPDLNVRYLLNHYAFAYTHTYMEDFETMWLYLLNKHLAPCT